MRGRRARLIWIALGWTVLALVIAVGLAVGAMASLYDRHQACFFSYPAVPCPAGDDPAVALLTFAFFGVPLIWLVGIGVVVVVWARRRPPP